MFYKVSGDAVLIIYYLFNIDIKNNRIFIPKTRINEITYGLDKLNINYSINGINHSFTNNKYNLYYDLGLLKHDIKLLIEVHDE